MIVRNGVTPLMGYRPIPVRLGFQGQLPKAPPVKRGASLGGFSWDRFVDVLPWIGGGTAGILIGRVLPPPIEYAVMAAGIGALTYGIYHTFKTPAAEKANQTTTGKNTLPSEDAFAAIRAQFIRPKMYERVNVALFGFTYNYWDIPVEIEVINPSDEEVSFNLVITQREVASTRMGLDVPREHTYESIPVKLAPRGRDVKKFDIDTLNWVGGLWENLVAKKVRPGYSDPGDKMAEVTFFAE